MIEVPKITNKYISLFSSEEAYNTAKADFEEVNWSDVAYPDETPDEYRVSRRLTNMYNKDNPPTYKFDNVDDYVEKIKFMLKDGKFGDYLTKIYPDAHKLLKYRLQDDADGHIRKTFFLEIIWGYSGWEWKDYAKIENPEDLDKIRYYIQDASNGKYMTLASNGVFIADEPYPLKIETDEATGLQYITDGTYYVGLLGTNNYTMSSDPSKKLAIKIQEVYNNVCLKEVKGYIGTDYATRGDTDPYCKADKMGDYYWNLITAPDSPEIRYIIYKGGNLYKTKQIETVQSIPDGYRLQHINDFLNSQDKVSVVEWFDTSNLISINRAFKRLTSINNGKNIVPCLLHIYEFPNVTEADELCVQNDVSVVDGHPISMPLLKSVDKLYYLAKYTDGLKFQMDSAESITDAFAATKFYIDIVDINNILVGDTLKHVKNLSGLLRWACISGYKDVDGVDTTTVKLDLTDSEVEGEIDLSNLCREVGPITTRDNNGTPALDRTLSIDLNFINDVNLDFLASGTVFKNKYTTPSGHPFSYIRNGSFNKINVNFNGKESHIKSLVQAFQLNHFIENLPIQQVPNNACDDKYIYSNCVFDAPITYDFLNGSIDSPREQGYGQFNDCTINDSHSFSNIQGLDRVEFCNIKFGDNVADENKAFPYVVQDQNDTTHRYFDMCNSQFTSIPAQNIYIDSLRMRDASDKYAGANSRLNPFQGCKNFTDLSGVHLYYKDEARTVNGFNLNFSGITNLTKTPYIHWDYGAAPNGYGYVSIHFGGLKNLVEVNFENFSFSGNAPGMSLLSFQDCTSLVYLKIATNTDKGFSGTLDIRGCTALDIPTLKATLLKMNKNQAILKCLESTWKAINDNDIDDGTVVSYFDNNGIEYEVTVDNSYKPSYPD